MTPEIRRCRAPERHRAECECALGRGCDGCGRNPNRRWCECVYCHRAFVSEDGARRVCARCEQAMIEAAGDRKDGAPLT